jgi:hypothetical protein
VQLCSKGPARCHASENARGCQILASAAGQQLEGLQFLAFKCLLQDAASVKRPLVDEEFLPTLVDVVPAEKDAGGRRLLGVLPDILRVLHSMVSRLARVADSLHCLEVIMSRYGALQQAISPDTAKESHSDSGDWSDVGDSAGKAEVGLVCTLLQSCNVCIFDARTTGTGVLQPYRCAERNSAIPLQGFNLARKVLTFAKGIQTKAAVGLGNAMSGLSIHARLLLRDLSTQNGLLTDAATASALCNTVEKLSLVVEAAFISAADAVAFRRAGLAGVLNGLGITEPWRSQQSTSSVTQTGQHGGLFPEWVLAVQVLNASLQQLVNCVHAALWSGC